MSNIKKTIGESPLRGTPKQKINLIIGDGKIKSRHIGNKQVTLEKLADEVMEEFQERISSHEETGIYVSNSFGESTGVAISQKTITDKFNEIEAAIASIDSNSGGHNILPFDGFVTILNRNAISNQKYTSSSQVVANEYTIVAERTLNAAEKFYLKVGDTYYTNWEITTEIPVTPVVGGDPLTTPESGVVSKSEWYYTEYRVNKLFYDRSNKVVYCYNYATSSLAPITNIQVVEENAPEAESTSNPEHATKGSIVVDLEHDKLLTWDGNKWKALSGGGSTPVDVPNSIAIRNRVLYLEKVSTGSEPVVFASVELPDGGGQTVLVQSNEDSPSIVRLNTDTSKLGKKVIPLGTSAANLFKNGIRQNDSDVYNQTTYSSDDGVYTVYHIKYEFDLNNSSVTVPEKSILKFEGGCLKNGTLVGNSTKVEVDGTYTIFDNMSFSGTFRDSNLYATNFGAIGNMVSVPKTLNFKNLDDLDINERTRLVNGADELNYSMAAGTESHDYTAFSKLCQFLSGSSNIHIILNGEFYVAKILVGNTGYTSEITINSADNLTIEGGTTTAAWQIKDCNNVTLLNTNYVGFHEIHKFPYIASDITGTYTEEVGGETVTKNYSDVCVKYINDTENSKFGVANPIRFIPTTDLTVENKDTYKYSTGFYVQNCNFEMRAYGLILGQSIKATSSAPVDKLKAVKSCSVENCIFDHIKCQAFSLHGATGTQIRKCSINYCNCPLDLGTGCTDTVFEDIVAEHCGMGFKQELQAFGHLIYRCNNNRVSNFKISIDSEYPYKRIQSDDYYAVKLDSGGTDDVLIVDNCTFTIDREEEQIGEKGLSFMPRVLSVRANASFDSCKFEIGKTNRLCDSGVSSNTNEVKFTNCFISIENDLHSVIETINGVDTTVDGSLFRRLGSVVIKSSHIELKSTISSSAFDIIKTPVGGFDVENSELIIAKGGNTFILPANSTIRNSRIVYNNTNNEHGFELKGNDIVLEGNDFDFTSTLYKGLFIVNSSIQNVKMSNNTFKTSSGLVYIGYTTKTVNGVETDVDGTIAGIEVKDNIIDYTNAGNVDSSTRSIINLGSSTKVAIDSNVFKGSVAREISDSPSYNTHIIGNLKDGISRNTIENIPAANAVKSGFVFYDTTNGRFLMSDGTQWNPISSPSGNSSSVPAYGAAENIPQTAQLGAIYFDTTNDVMKVYNGSAWVSSLQQVIPDSAGTSYNTDVPDVDAGYLFRVTSANNEIRMKLKPTGQLWQALPLTNDCIVVSGSGKKGDFDTTDYTQTKQIYYATDEGKYYLWYPAVEGQRGDSGLYEIPINHIALSSGTFNNAPDINEVVLGYTYYDTVRQKILTATSEGWTDNEGNVITIATKGTTSQRPAVTDVTEGFKYYNTQIHKEQVYNGTTWIDIEDAASTGIRIDSLVPDVVTGSALSTTLAADINKYYRYDTAVDTLTVTLPELVSSSKVQNVVVYLTAGSNADSTTITFTAATPTEGTAAPVYYQKSYDIEAGKTYEINALYNGAAWIIAAVEIVTAVAQSSNSNNNSNSNSLLMGGFTPADTNGDTASTDVEPNNTEDI